jgi:hypothetical protein
MTDLDHVKMSVLLFQICTFYRYRPLISQPPAYRGSISVGTRQVRRPNHEVHCFFRLSHLVAMRHCHAIENISAKIRSGPVSGCTAVAELG